MASLMILFKAVLRFGVSEARRPTNLAPVAAQSSSASCSKRRPCEAMFGPVMMKPAAMLPLDDGSAPVS